MPLRAEAVQSDPGARELFQLPSKGFVSVDESGYPLIEALADSGFCWFLEWAWPANGLLQIVPMTLPDKRKAIQLKDAKQRTILQLAQEPSGNWFGQQRGDFPLWQRIRRYYRSYQALHHPGKAEYQVQMNAERAILFVNTHEQSLDLRDLFPID